MMQILGLLAGPILHQTMACIDGLDRVMRRLGMTLPSFDIQTSTGYCILKRMNKERKEVGGALILNPQFKREVENGWRGSDVGKNPN
jgi:hypothetical protein